MFDKQPRASAAPDLMVLLGAAGDLSTRHLLPSLLRLRRAGGLPEDFRVVGVGREQLSTQSYRLLVDRALREQVPDASEGERAWLLGALDYQALDVTGASDLSAVIGRHPALVYCALPPWAYPGTLTALARSGLPSGSRLALEKPVGEDLASARLLNDLVRQVTDEASVFRVDHFLHHQVVQDVLALRLSSPLLAAAWSHQHIASVDVVWEEADGVRGRAPYFDRTGTLRDMIQSHLLQVLALLAMEPPTSLDAVTLRACREEVLRLVRSPTPEHGGQARTMRARYAAGQVRGQRIEAYAESPGVLTERGTETYAAVVLEVAAPRWVGVPFVLRSGQAIGAPRREIVVRFSGAAGGLPPRPALLRLQMSPPRIGLEVGVAAATGLPELVATELRGEPAEQTMPASARLLRDILAGDQALFLGANEVEECWRITDTVARTWAADETPLASYPAGSAGPRMPDGPLADLMPGPPSALGHSWPADPSSRMRA